MVRLEDGRWDLRVPTRDDWAAKVNLFGDRVGGFETPVIRSALSWWCRAHFALSAIIPLPFGGDRMEKAMKSRPSKLATRSRPRRQPRCLPPRSASVDLRHGYALGRTERRALLELAAALRRPGAPGRASPGVGAGSPADFTAATEGAEMIACDCTHLSCKRGGGYTSPNVRSGRKS
jgi:hypothetical protein